MTHPLRVAIATAIGAGWFGSIPLLGYLVWHLSADNNFVACVVMAMFVFGFGCALAGVAYLEALR